MAWDDIQNGETWASIVAKLNTGGGMGDDVAAVEATASPLQSVWNAGVDQGEYVVSPAKVKATNRLVLASGVFTCVDGVTVSVLDTFNVSSIVLNGSFFSGVLSVPIDPTSLNVIGFGNVYAYSTSANRGGSVSVFPTGSGGNISIYVYQNNSSLNPKVDHCSFVLMGYPI